MAYVIGASGDIGTVYSDDDIVKGKAPIAGTRTEQITSSGTKEFVFCRVAASQNLVKGHVVTISSTFVATIQAAGTPAPTSRQFLGVAVCTATASVSAGIWCQIWGIGQVLASAATNANVPLVGGVVAGTVGDTLASASAIIEGIILPASAGASQALTTAMLLYPRYETYH